MDFNHTLRVLVVREDAMWCATLDMSLRGYGKTQAEAVENLTESVEDKQISFAVQHDTLDEIFVPAEPSYHGQLYESVKRDSVKRHLLLEIEARTKPSGRKILL